ncbi:hypothetical protein [Mycobacterium sp.]|uniref:hypothetical protein n=1 Tax=Mycobacterium sp. TaxID=1785 RepID=UPI0025DD7AB0|nr:hypothetical protein [Mycobacterium sp.]
MHQEFNPADAPDPDDPDVQFGVPPDHIAAELLALCADFFGQAGPVVYAEVDQFLTQRGHPGGLGWFLDALGFASHDRTSRVGRAPR